MEEIITLQREELYRQVWATPITKLAKGYGISGNRLAVICSKLTVPVPPRGHWARLAHGHPVKQPPLPEPPADGRLEYTLQGSNAGSEKPHVEKSDVQKNIPIVPVPDSLKQAHPLVRHFRVRASQQDVKYLDKGMIKIRDDDMLNIKASPKLLTRAMRIMDAILKYAVSQRWKISIGKGFNGYETRLNVDGEDVAIDLSEKLSLQKRIPKKGDKYFWEGNDWVPTGILVLRITNAFSSGLRQNWIDGNKKIIEDHLGHFMLALREASVHIKQRRLQREEDDRRYQEEQRQREEAERQRQLEEKAIEELESQALSWEKSNRIRTFLCSLKERLSKDNPVRLNDNDFQQWFAWAYSYAERLDPLNSPQTSLAK